MFVNGNVFVRMGMCLSIIMNVSVRASMCLLERVCVYHNGYVSVRMGIRLLECVCGYVSVRIVLEILILSEWRDGLSCIYYEYSCIIIVHIV